MPLKIPAILAPTASGKTSVGIALAKKINAEIISVDSRKVYRGLPVGTAAPDGVWENNALQVQGVPHHLIGHLRLDQTYTAGDFARDAARLIDEIKARGKRPLLVGGTGFYFKSLVRGLPALPQRDEDLRRRLQFRCRDEGLSVLRKELEKADPASAAAIDPKDQQKTLRALEVFYLAGKPFSEFKDEKRLFSEESFVVMGLDWPKGLLDRRIEERSAQMLEHGMLEETQAALKEGFAPDCAALASFGYKDAVLAVRGEITRTEFLQRLIKGTKAYAKRQRTWFRTQTKPAWFPCDNVEDKEELSLKMKAFLDRSHN